MMDDSYDVVVVGGGPSGSTSAWHHTKLGLKTLLIDKAFFPRDKVCGDGIPNKVLRLIKEMGIYGSELEKIGYRINAMNLYSPEGNQLKYGEMNPESEAKSFCSKRLLFDNLLFQKVKEINQHVYDGITLESLEYTGDNYILTLRNRRTDSEIKISTLLIIGADGAKSRVRKLLNLETVDQNYKFDGFSLYAQSDNFEPEIHIFYDEMTVPGYFWIFPVSETVANLGIMVDKNTCQKNRMNIRDMFYRLLQNNKDIKKHLNKAELIDNPQGCPLTLGHKNIPAIADGAILIGDAASMINPITGGGIYYGMISGINAAQISLTALDSRRFKKNDLTNFAKFYEDQLLPGYNVANHMRDYFTEKGKVNRLFRKCNKNRIYKNLLISLYGRPVTKYFYLNPTYWKSIIKN